MSTFLVAVCFSMTVVCVGPASQSAPAPVPADSEVALRRRIVERLDVLAGVLDSHADSGFAVAKNIAGSPAKQTPNIVRRAQADLVFGKLLSVEPESVANSATAEVSDFGRSSAAQDASSKAAALRSYANHIRMLRDGAKTAPLSDVLRSLTVSYVPDNVAIVFGGSAAAPAPTDSNPGKLQPFGGPAYSFSGLMPFIVGNGDTTVDYPSVGALLYRDPQTGGNIMRCTGTLVAPSVVLTAQHCVPTAGAPTGVYFQHAGTYAIADIVRYPGYVFPVNDIALVFLKQAVVGLLPVAVNHAGAPKGGTLSRIVGFGYHTNQSIPAAARATSTSTIIMKTGIKAAGDVTSSACAAPHQSDHLICWTYSATALGIDPQSSTCEGDSGGPLFVYAKAWQLAGITAGSASGPACRPGDNLIDTDVSFYASWIDATIQRHPMPTANSAGKNYAYLVPALDNSSRFVASATDLIFDGSATWSQSFDISSKPAAVFISVNATPSGSPIRLTVGQKGAAPICNALSDYTAVTCPLNAPSVGSWTVTVSGAPWQEYQFVATLF